MGGSRFRMTSLGTVRTFMKVGTCSETLFNVIDRACEQPLKVEERASMLFAGGIMRHGYQCGQLWGAALAAGARAHRLLGAGPEAEAAAIHASQRVVETFRALNGHINCLELTETDLNSKWKSIKFFILKGGTIGCFRMAARYAPVALEAIESALSGERAEAPKPPVSCASLLARRMGASEEHSVMAAGLAGGIGLSGGACGALGAALWILAMRAGQEGVGDDVWHSDLFQSRAGATIDRFLGSSGHTFECSRIAGRRFESVTDHAGYLHDGGCSKIIEALASTG